MYCRLREELSRSVPTEHRAVQTDPGNWNSLNAEEAVEEQEALPSESSEEVVVVEAPKKAKRRRLLGGFQVSRAMFAVLEPERVAPSLQYEKALKQCLSISKFGPNPFQHRSATACLQDSIHWQSESL